jgi:hypothetical protein
MGDQGFSPERITEFSTLAKRAGTLILNEGNHVLDDAWFYALLRRVKGDYHQPQYGDLIMC